MAKMSFPNTVNYNGTIYPARSVFTVNDADVEELRKNGGWVVEKSKSTKATKKEN
jgi:hypothetical protein